MLIRAITYLVTLSLGALGSYLFLSSNQQPESKKISQLSSQIDVSTLQVGDSINQQTLDKLNLLIKSQQIKIKELQNTRSANTSITGQAEEFQQSENLEDDISSNKLESISEKSFQGLISDHFIDQFKGYSVEVESIGFERMTKSFDRNKTRADWNDAYEENINNFIYESDTDGIHYLEQVICNSNTCRIKVITDEGDKWEKLI